MPSDDYASASAGGALKLKGGKVEKHKHKKHKHKKRDKEKLAKAVEEEEERQEDDERKGGHSDSDREGKKKKKRKDKDDTEENEDEKEDPYARMTPAERRFAEAQDKKIRDLLHATPEEARASRPELFKSHKERLADLNTYLSRMSEHHDMPKIGPG